MSTIDYYNRNAEEFYNQTVNVDMSKLYQPFLELIPKGGAILDAGCGSGRDTLYFVKQGYNVTSFDASEAMVKMSSKLTGQKTFHLSFDEVDFENKFDGIWACASLLHIPRKDINVALNKLTRALKCQGILYASFKYGSLELNKSKRFFNNYDEDSFLQLLSEHLSLELIRFYITEDVRPEKSNEKWLNVLLQKNNS